MEEAVKIENAYKELHSGIYEYGNKKIEEAIKLGYIESIMGFKLHLVNYEWFKEKHNWINSLDRSFWTSYKEGKLEYKKLKKAEENKEEYIVKNEKSLTIYRQNAFEISKYFKQRGEYFRLCLNSPTQAMAAHQTKAATNRIFEYIWKNNHFWKARLSLVVHDEIDMEVIDDLADEYAKVISSSMIEEGNKLLKNKKLFMQAETNIANNWWDAK